MNKVRICFRLQDAAVDENGNPAPAGMCITIGETDKEVNYTELTADLNKHALMAAFGLNSIDTDKLELITPEEFDKEYGEEDDDGEVQ